MILTSHLHPEPFRVTACRNTLTMRGEREPALCLGLEQLAGNRPLASISSSLPMRASRPTATA